MEVPSHPLGQSNQVIVRALCTPQTVNKTSRPASPGGEMTRTQCVEESLVDNLASSQERH